MLKITAKKLFTPLCDIVTILTMSTALCYFNDVGREL